MRTGFWSAAKVLLAWLGCGLLVVLPWGAARAGDAGSPADRSAPRVVTVAAAADLRFAMDELAQEFRAAHPEVELKINYGSSGNFYSQISNGAPFDLFFSADVEYAHRLVAAGLALPGSEFVYAVGGLVLWVPRASPLDVSRGQAVLRDPAVRRIAIANPQHAPYGRAAEAALRKWGLYDEVKARLVFGENVVQTAQFAQSGAADIGIIALSLARAPTLAREGRFWEVPREAYPRLEQGGVILRSARDPSSARAFRDFVLGDRGRAVLERYGFSRPGR